MQIHETNGKNFTVFDGFFKGHIETFNRHSKELIINQKLGVAYNIPFRMNNTRRVFKDSNTEQMDIVFDHNLSKNGYYSHINFETQESIQIKLLKAVQPDYGRTQIKIAVEYINTKQELFENLEYIYCDSVGGRVERKLEKIIEAFQKECIKLLGRYPFYDRSRWNNLGDLKQVILRAEQVEEIDKCIELIRDKRFNDAFKNASFQRGGCTEFEYKIFKEYLNNN